MQRHDWPIQLKFPAHWVTAAVVGEFHDPRLMPVPEWDAEIGEDRHLSAMDLNEPTDTIM